MLKKEMNNYPLISIVTVTYNAIDTIEETILSVINQDYPNIEYIIVDGGSTDGTIDIIKKYQTRLSKWISEKDKGLYDAMNKGLRMATGMWVSFKNSGDFFAEKNSLSKLFKEPVPDGVTFIHADCYRVTDWGWRIEKPLDLSVYKKIMPIIHPSTFVRTEYHKKHLFEIKYRVSADYNLIYNALEEGCKFEYRPVPVVIFPTGGFSTNHWEDEYWGGLSIQGKLKTFNQRFIAYCEFIILALKRGIKKILKKISFLRQHHDKKQKAMYREMPLPLEKYY